jgi:hypothetical protein
MEFSKDSSSVTVSSLQAEKLGRKGETLNNCFSFDHVFGFVHVLLFYRSFLRILEGGRLRKLEVEMFPEAEGEGLQHLEVVQCLQRKRAATSSSYNIHGGLQQLLTVLSNTLFSQTTTHPRGHVCGGLRTCPICSGRIQRLHLRIWANR